MEEIIQNNINLLNNCIVSKDNTEIIKEIISTLNKERIVLFSGMRGFGKTSVIKELINKTNIKNYLYFNDEIDNQNKIKNHTDFFKMLEFYENKNGKCKLIIIQNINKIKNIKKIITDLYNSKKYKILITGNNIDIPNIKNINYCINRFIQYNNFSKEKWLEILKYGNIDTIKTINHNKYKEIFLKNLVDSIVLNDIFFTYSIKSPILYKYIITILSFLDKSVSLRELNRFIENNGLNISLSTLIDYIDFTINSKIIKKCFTYDLEKNKIIVGKNKFYFSDLGIKNTIAGKKLDNSILIENLIYNHLLNKYKTVYNGVKGRYKIDFYIQNLNYCIILSNNTILKDLKKETKKLEKIKSDKIIILSDLEMINYKETINGIKILGLNNLYKI